MWLASVSLHRKQQPVLTGDYTAHEHKRAYRILRQHLAGVGDARWGRFYRLNLTYGLQRGLTDAEIAQLPSSWETDKPIHLAGGPVEVFWSFGMVPGVISADPCHNPVPHYVSPTLWIPDDCGQCPPCVARIAVRKSVEEA